MKVTIFNDLHASKGEEKSLDINKLAALIASTSAPAKNQLPLLKLGRFGDTPNPKGSYRWAGNIDTITGVELDYDGEVVSFDDVCATLRDAGVQCIAYTSPRWTAETPRWRVLFPLARAVKPSQRKRWAEVADEIIGDLAAAESYTLAQCFYFGRVNDSFQLEIIDGEPLDKIKRTSRSYEKWLEMIGDHEGGAGFYNPIKSAIASFIAVNKNDDGLLELLERTIRNANRTKHTERYINGLIQNNVPKLIGWTLEKESDKSDFDTDRNGKPYPTQANLLVALQREHVKLTYDEFADKCLIETPESTPTVLVDALMVELRLAIDRDYSFLVNKDLFCDVIQNVARTKGRFHPVLDWLKELEWDGVPRLETWTIRHLGSPDNEYVRAVSPLHFMAAIRRVREPGCEFHECLVLVDPNQGAGKSMVIKTICPRREWFTDDLDVGADSKTVLEKTGGKWIIELAELSKAGKRAIEEIKTFQSRNADKARAAYAHLAEEVLRKFVTFGTTNNTAFLRDDQNRRFWPMEVTKKVIDIAALKKERDQLWAEAVVREAQEGASIRLDEKYWEMAAEVQADHRISDPWEDELAEMLEDTPIGKVRSADVIIALGKSGGKNQQAGDNQRLADAMKAIGWLRGRLSWGRGKKKWCFYRGTNAEREMRIVIDMTTFDPSALRQTFVYEKAASKWAQGNSPELALGDDCPF